MLFAAFAGAQTASREFPVDSIAVEGNRILTPTGIIAASGLKIGAKGDTPTFDAARDRLLATGYFETVGYKFKPSEKGSGYEVTFDVQEMQPLYTIRVEALGATADEITRYLKSKDPLFTGRIPGTQQVLDRTSREIEALLESKNKHEKVAGRIVIVSAQHFEAQFTPARGLPNVSLVSFEGNKVVRDTTLQNAIAAVAFGQPYTESNFRALLDNQIKPLYEKQGYMRVTFPKIVTAPSTQVKGIDVKVTIVEGLPYKLGAVSVRGPMADESKHILRVAKIPPMATADFDQIRAAAVRVQNSLRNEGYLDALVTTDRNIDDNKRIVDVFIVPNPGPQYFLGKLIVKGLGLDAEAAIRKTWGVKTGEPYPGDYPDYFLKRIKDEGIFDHLGDTRSVPEINPDTHIVDVTLVFGFAPDSPKKKPQDPGQGLGPDGFPFPLL